MVAHGDACWLITPCMPFQILLISIPQYSSDAYLASPLIDSLVACAAQAPIVSKYYGGGGAGGAGGADDDEEEAHDEL